MGSTFYTIPTSSMDGSTELLSYFGIVSSEGYVFISQNERTSLIDADNLGGRTIIIDWKVYNEKPVWYFFYPKNKISVRTAGSTDHVLRFMGKVSNGTMYTAPTTTKRETTTFVIPSEPNTYFTFGGGNSCDFSIYSVKIR